MKELLFLPFIILVMKFFALNPAQAGLFFTAPNSGCTSLMIAGKMLDWLIWILLPLVVLACVIEYRSIRKSLGQPPDVKKQYD